jgi:hypothetical protein
MFTAQSLGLLIGATVTNMKTALSVTTVVMLTIMLVAGFYVRNIPVSGGAEVPVCEREKGVITDL